MRMVLAFVRPLRLHERRAWRERRLASGSCAIVLACVASGCGDGGPGAGDTVASVIATTSIWADITSHVLCGTGVPAVIPAGSDPHTFEPSLRDRALVEHAGVVIANGSLEDSLEDMLSTAADGGTDVVRMTDHIEQIGDDPHVWQDVDRIARAVPTIATVAIAHGAPEATTSACATSYATELRALDAEIAGLIDTIPIENRVMVTSHDSLEYFADRYGLEIIGTIIPSTNTMAQSNAADLAALADLVRERHVPAVLTEQLESTSDADALAERLGVRVVPLVTDALTDDPATDTYVEMMRSNAALVAEALQP